MNLLTLIFNQLLASYLQSDNHMLWSSISTVRTPTRGEDGITVLAAYSGATALYQQEAKLMIMKI